MNQISINRVRILEEFQELTDIDSVSLSERGMADCLKRKLLELGFEAEEDCAGGECGGNAGNLYGFLKGSLPGPSVLLSAHMDTVEPGTGKHAVFQPDGRITGSGSTVLGADDAAGLVEILEGIRSVREAGIPHRDIEVLFPIAEELYVKGTEVFDFTKVRSREAYVLDLSGPVGTAALQAPTLISFQASVTGKSSHAGFEPEAGIHAITAVCRAVSRIRQGHVDEDTTVNIGTIGGGTATNIVPKTCVCCGEIRSYRHEKALSVLEEIRKVFEDVTESMGAKLTLESTTDLTAYKIEEKDPVVQQFRKACERIGIAGQMTRTFGGSDNHNFTKHGIHGIVLSCGMYNAHSTDEYTTERDLVLGAMLIAELIQHVNECGSSSGVGE